MNINNHKSLQFFKVYKALLLALLLVVLPSCSEPPSVAMGGDGCFSGPNTGAAVSKIILATVIDPVLTILYGTSVDSSTGTLSFDQRSGGLIQQMYTGIISDAGGVFINALRAALVIYIALYGIYFMVGLTQINQFDFLKRLFKVAIIIQLISPSSWDFFYNNFMIVFTKGTYDLINITGSLMSGQGGMTNFSFLDNSLGKILDVTTWIKVLSLIFAGPFGFIVSIIAVWGLVAFAITGVKALVAYLISLIGMALLIGLAPIFITFILFKQTESMFQRWISMLFNHMLQPFLIFTCLGIFSTIFDEAINQALGFSVCWKNVLSFEIPMLGEVGVIRFWLPSTIDNSASFGDMMYAGMNFITGGLGNTIPAMITLVIVGMSADKICVEYAPTLANMFTGMTMAPSYGRAANAAIHGALSAMPFGGQIQQGLGAIQNPAGFAQRAGLRTAAASLAPPGGDGGGGGGAPGGGFGPGGGDIGSGNEGPGVASRGGPGLAGTSDAAASTGGASQSIAGAASASAFTNTHPTPTPTPQTQGAMEGYLRSRDNMQMLLEPSASLAGSTGVTPQFLSSLSAQDRAQSLSNARESASEYLAALSNDPTFASENAAWIEREDTILRSLEASEQTPDNSIEPPSDDNQ